MKNVIATVVLAVVMMVMVGCGNQQAANNSTAGTYQQRMTQFRSETVAPNKPMMVGDSITQIWGWKATFPKDWTNRGIAGDDTQGVLRRLQEHIDNKPSEIVLLIGANNYQGTVAGYTADMNRIVDMIYAANIPLTIISCLPASDTGRDGMMKIFNDVLVDLCNKRNIRFVNLYSEFTVAGHFNQTLFTDKVHPNDAGYQLLKDLFVERHIIEEVK